MAPDNADFQAQALGLGSALVIAGHSDQPLTPVLATQQREIVDAWLRALEQQVMEGQLSSSSIRPYRRAASTWLSYLEAHERTALPGPSTVGRFVAWYRAGRSAQTVNLALAALRNCYRFAEAAQMHPDIARSALRLRTERRQPMACLEHAEVAQILAQIQGDDLRACRDRAMVAVAYGTAVRASSLASMDVGGVDLTGGTVQHRAKGRRGEPSTAYLPPGAAQAVAIYLRARHAVAPLDNVQPLWIALDRRAWGARLSTGGILRVVAALLERAGHRRRFPDGRLVARGVWGPHALRRSSLTRVVGELGLEAARAVAQHSSTETIRRHYAAVQEDRQMRQAARLLDIAVPRST
jgi:site-specific recombinase XerD